MTAVSVDTADKLNHIRRQLMVAGVAGKPGKDMELLATVLEYVGDSDLVVDALLMTPRPDWLWELVGYDLSLPGAARASTAPQIESD